MTLSRRLPPEPDTNAPPNTTREADTGPGDQLDLATAAPVIGRVGAASLGALGLGCWLRPPNVAADGTTAGAFHIAAASIIGASHLQGGQPRQDAYNMMLGTSGRLYVAIADGLGSRPASQLGAQLFTDSMLHEAAQDEPATPTTATELLHRSSRRTAQLVTGTHHLDVRDTACVGAVAVFSRSGCDIARVGDVAAFTLVDGDFPEAFPVDSEFVNLVRTTLPGEQPDDVQAEELGPAQVVILATDGLANDLRNSPDLRTWLAERWRTAQGPFAMANALRYRRQGSHDDRTAVVVWRTTEP
jgi:serine/threonine protein phosphatase PrpC